MEKQELEAIKKRLESEFAAEVVTIGTSIDNAKTGQMFAYDAERLAMLAHKCYIAALETAQAEKGQIIATLRAWEKTAYGGYHEALEDVLSLFDEEEAK